MCIRYKCLNTFIKVTCEVVFMNQQAIRGCHRNGILIAIIDIQQAEALIWVFCKYSYKINVCIRENQVSGSHVE